MDLSASDPVSVSIRDAHVAYDGDWLFERFSMDLQAGEISCLLGPSGVGKSTLLRLAAGLIPPTNGASITDGLDRPLGGRMAWMGQQDLLLPWATVLDNIVLGFTLRGERPDLDRAHALIDAVGLTGRDTDRPAALSGGMRQRAALARTLMEDKPIVLMDEPFSAVDAITRFELQNLAARLLAGRTVLLVTHDPMEALRLADVVYVMSGTPARIDAGIRPPGAKPRDAADPALARLQADLLGRLSTAKGLR